MTASAVLLSGIDPATGLPSTLKMLWFVNDLARPEALHDDDKDVLAPDGYPAVLGNQGRPRADAACVQDAPCQGSGSVCATWAIDCSSGIPACVMQGPAPDGTTCGPAGEVCTTGTCTGTAGAPVVVRTASGGAVDLTGTTWTVCHPGDPSPGMSRWTSDVYELGTITHREEVYVASLDCTGTTDPDRSFGVSAAIETAGDRIVGWTNGTPPAAGLPASVVATGVVISGTDPGTGTTFSFRDLRFVDDLHEWPRALYQGNGDGPLELDGFPAQLANDPSREPATLATYDPLTATTLDGERWQTPLFTRSISGAKAVLAVRADGMQARTVQGLTYTNPLNIASGGNRVTTLRADVTVPSGSATRTGTAAILGGIRLNYQPSANRGLPFPAQNMNFLSAWLDLFDDGYTVFRCASAACTSSTWLTGGALTPSGGHPLGVGTVHTLLVRSSPATNLFTFRLDDAAPVQVDMSALAPAAAPTPHVPVKYIVAGVTIGGSAAAGASAAIDAAVNDVRVAP